MLSVNRHGVDCLGCGTNLTKRYMGRRVWGSWLVDWWRCPCGRKRIVKLGELPR